MIMYNITQKESTKLKKAEQDLFLAKIGPNRASQIFFSNFDHH